ncbi:MAG: hypothetical protein WCA29_01240 [Jiangellales bacterium]
MPVRQPRARVYVAATPAMLVGLVQSGSMPTRGIGYAVTPQVREAGPDGDDDEWEFEAFGDAAAAGVGLLDPDSGGLRRVVVSVDLDPADVAPADGPPSSAVAVPGEVRRRSVAAVHVDDEQAGAVIARVLEGAPAWLLDDVALDWFDASELESLVDQLSRT